MWAHTTTHIVKMVEEFEKEFQKLKESVENGSNANRDLVEMIENGIKKLKQNYKHGIPIPKKQFPKSYILKFDINNLWKLDLSKYWRMLYTVVGNKSEIIAVILDSMDHKEYDKIFGYKTT